MTIGVTHAPAEVLAALTDFDAPDVIEAVESAHQVRAAIGDNAALVALRSSNRHPDLWRLRLASAESLPDDAAEPRFGELWPAMRESGQPGQVLAVFETDHRFAPQLLQRFGFSPVQSRTGTISTARFGSSPTAAPDGFTLRRCDDLDESHIDWYEQTYDRCHRWAGRYVRYHDETPWVSFCGPVVPGGVVEVRNDAWALELVVSLHRTDDDHPIAGGAEPFLAVAEPDTMEAAEAFDAALRLLLDAVGDTRTIRWEADSTYPHLWEWISSGAHQVDNEFTMWSRPSNAMDHRELGTRGS